MTNEHHDRRKLLELDVLGDATTWPVQDKTVKKEERPETSQAYGHVTFTLFLLMVRQREWKHGDQINKLIKPKWFFSLQGCSSLSVIKIFPSLQLAHGWNNLVRSQNFPDLDDALGSEVDNFNGTRCYEPENEKILASLYESYKTLGPRPLTYLVTSMVLTGGIFLVTTVSMFMEYFRRVDNEPFDKMQVREFFVYMCGFITYGHAQLRYSLSVSVLFHGKCGGSSVQYPVRAYRRVIPGKLEPIRTSWHLRSPGKRSGKMLHQYWSMPWYWTIALFSCKNSSILYSVKISSVSHAYFPNSYVQWSAVSAQWSLTTSSDVPKIVSIQQNCMDKDWSKSNKSLDCNIRPS